MRLRCPILLGFGQCFHFLMDHKGHEGYTKDTKISELTLANNRAFKSTLRVLCVFFVPFVVQKKSN
jgi:hypothetical protein